VALSTSRNIIGRLISAELRRTSFNTVYLVQANSLTISNLNTAISTLLLLPPLGFGGLWVVPYRE